MENWAELPVDVIILIARRLDLGEFISFRGTCTSWRLSTNCDKDSQQKKKQSWCPFLMINRVRDIVDSDDREFFDFYRGKVISISLPQIKNKVCIGSKGWFIAIGSSGDMSLFNPITRFQIHLPNISDTESYCWVKRGILSASPKTGSDYVVMIVYVESPKESNFLGFWKPKDPAWTKIDTPVILEKGVQDLAYHNGMFYALSHPWQVYMLDVSCPGPITPIQIIDLQAHISRVFRYNASFFVECGGTLLVVSSCHQLLYDCSPHRVLELVELDFANGTCTRTMNLGDNNAALFIGHNEGFSVDAMEFPGVIQPEFIYQSNGSYQLVGCQVRTNISPNIKAGTFYSDDSTGPLSSNYGNVWLTPDY